MWLQPLHNRISFHECSVLLEVSATYESHFPCSTWHHQHVAVSAEHSWMVAGQSSHPVVHVPAGLLQTPSDASAHVDHQQFTLQIQTTLVAVWSTTAPPVSVVIRASSWHKWQCHLQQLLTWIAQTHNSHSRIETRPHQRASQKWKELSCRANLPVQYCTSTSTSLRSSAHCWQPYPREGS